MHEPGAAPRRSRRDRSQTEDREEVVVQLSDHDRQVWFAEQELLDRVMAVVCCPGPCDRVTVDAALLARSRPDHGPYRLSAHGTGRSAQHPGVLVIPYPRNHRQA